MKIHGDNRLYWQYQYDITAKHLLPLWESWGLNLRGKKVLEIGAGEGGIVSYLADNGAFCTALEYDSNRAEIGRNLTGRNIEFITGDICQLDEHKKFKGPYDFIVLRDVLEHLPDKSGAMYNISALMHDESYLFLETCPWHMPFGGHQQVLKSALGKIPFLHLLPKSLYFRLLEQSGAPDFIIDDLKMVYHCRNTTGQVLSLVKDAGMRIIKRQAYISNPAYKIRFGLPVIKGNLLGRIPFLRDFLISSIYLLLKKQ
ncbi:class I SAM-dependent methyltransferase [bacterium]|nr:class I SAM-dependent methyltransferase [bacterium]